MSQLKPLMEKNFLEYASYVIVDRAIPDIRDGCKPVHRRILNTLFEMNDGKYHKVANVVGETMKLHPHGDASIYDALVVLANKEYFIDKQGNFGNIVTGHSAAAARYIECRLTPLALDTLFNKALTEYIQSYDGRKKEPLYLPVKLPVLLMLGTEGIAVGMSTKILPHNFMELLEAQIKILNKQTPKIFPDFMTGGQIDVSEYEDGKGKVNIRAKIDIINDKTLIIREIPFFTTTSNLISSIESAIQKGKVGIGSINDFTTDKVEIELKTQRGITSEEVLPRLYAYTDCEISISSNIVVIRNNHPAEITVTEYLKGFTFQLKKQLRLELEYELKNLTDKQHWLTLEQIFIINRVYKRIEKAGTEEKIKSEVYLGMEPFKKQFIRKMNDDDVKRLLDIKIRRISAYDIKKHQDDIDDIVIAIDECNKKLKNMTKTTIGFIQGLIDKYRGFYPRKTEISSFDTIDKKEVAKANIRLSYDRETGFFGSSIKSNAFQLTVSEYDRILAISSDGTYRIMSPPEKILLSGKLIYCDLFDQERGLKISIVYLDENRVSWGKKVHIEKYITDKIYNLFKESSKGMQYFSIRKVPDKIKLHFVPSKRQKIHEAYFDLNELGFSSNSSRGTRLHSKKVKKISIVKEIPELTIMSSKKKSVQKEKQKNVNKKTARDSRTPAKGKKTKYKTKNSYRKKK